MLLRQRNQAIEVCNLKQRLSRLAAQPICESFAINHACLFKCGNECFLQAQGELVNPSLECLACMPKAWSILLYCCTNKGDMWLWKWVIGLHKRFYFVGSVRPGLPTRKNLG